MKRFVAHISSALVLCTGTQVISTVDGMQDQLFMNAKITNKHAPTAEAHLHGTTFLPVSKPKPVFKKTCIFMAPSQKSAHLFMEAFLI